MSPVDTEYLATVDNVVCDAATLRKIGCDCECYAALRLAVTLMLRWQTRELKNEKKRICCDVRMMADCNRSLGRISREIHQAVVDSFTKTQVPETVDLHSSFLVVRMLRKEVGGVR